VRAPALSTGTACSARTEATRLAYEAWPAFLSTGAACTGVERSSNEAPLITR